MMRSVLTVCAAITTSAGVAYASDGYQFMPMRGMHWSTSTQDRSIVPNDQYTVYTGLADDLALFYLPENDPPSRDDVVTFNGVEEQINDYLNIPGFPLLGQRRFVGESSTTNGDGSRTDTITIRAVDAFGQPADLFPDGLTFNGISLPHGGVGLGLDMPPVLGGSQPLNLAPGSVVTGLSVESIRDGFATGPIELTPEDFLFPSPADWDGQLGLVAFGAANNGAIDSQVIIRITSVVPEPAACPVLGVVLLMRRRWVR